MIASPATERLLRIAGRAVARAGLVHAYGHCSLRLDDSYYLVSPSKPLGLVGTEDHCHILNINDAIPDHILGEVRIHREIYRRRPDVNGIIRSMPPHVMTLAAHGIIPQPRHGFGTYFSAGLSLWEDPQLLRSDEAASALAEQLHDGNAIMMRGNGAVIAASSIEKAVVLTWYLDDMARIELAGRCANIAAEHLSEDQCAERGTWKGGIAERMFQYLSDGDPEV